MTSIGRFDNWTSDSEYLLNKQINIEYMGSYQYHALYCYFARDDIAFKNIASFFYKSCIEKRNNADTLVTYQIIRGGKVILENIAKPLLEFNNNTSKSDILLGFELALQLEQQVYKSLLELPKIADNSYDYQCSNYIASNFLGKQVKSIHELSINISHLRKIGTSGHALWNFDTSFDKK